MTMAIRELLVSPEITQRIPASELSALLKVGSALASSLDLEVVLQTAIESACAVLKLETGAIYQLREGRLYLGAATPPIPAELSWLLDLPEAPEDHPHLMRALVECRPVCLADALVEPLSPAESAVRDARHLRSILYIPLLMEKKGIGVMVLGTQQRVRHFKSREIDLCRVLAYQVTLAVINARLYAAMRETNVELSRSYDATLAGWSMALDMRDQETQGHTQRVSRMTLNLAHAMGLPDGCMTDIRRGALLHDIGKMSIPDAILKKAGPLTEPEWAVMRRHPQYAYQFLSQIDYLVPALDIPYCHHEKWDGSGYPRGMRGDEIPLTARIFAVADVFDALTSDRTYRKAWSKAETLEYIAGQSGKHFDREAARSFLKTVEKQEMALG